MAWHMRIRGGKLRRPAVLHHAHIIVCGGIIAVVGQCGMMRRGGGVARRRGVRRFHRGMVMRGWLWKTKDLFLSYKKIKTEKNLKNFLKKSKKFKKSF